MAGTKRSCSACGELLSRYNTSPLCTACAKIGPTALIPTHLWRRPDMLEALRDHDFGQVSKLLQQWTPLTQRQIAEMVGKDQPGLSRIENTKQKVTHVGVFFRFVEGLGIPLELVLPQGLAGSDVSGDDPTQRRTLLHDAAGVAAEMLTATADETTDSLHELLGRAKQSANAPRIGKPEIQTLRETVDDLYSLDARLGGDRLWRLALAQLQWVETVVNNCSYSDATGYELQRMAGELKTSIGWYSFDAGLQQQAHQYFSEALNLAYMTNDHLLIMRTLANMARHAVHLGKPREAVLLAQRGSENSGKFVTPRVRSLLAIREAQGWAALRQDKPYSEAIRRAHSTFARGFAERDPEWVSFLNEAEFACLEGMSRSDLRHYDPAQKLLETSVELHTDGFRRNMGIGLARLSLNWLRKSHPERAATIAKESALVAAEITSTRMRGELKALAHALVPHQGLPVVDDALHSLASVV